MSDIDIIRDEKRTEDDKMEIIADILESDEQSVKVVQIEDMSGTLSDEEFKAISSNSCIMMASTQYFYKQYSASTVIRYGAIPRVGSNKVIFDYIDIDKATKAYELKNETYPAA